MHVKYELVFDRDKGDRHLKCFASARRPRQLKEFPGCGAERLAPITVSNVHVRESRCLPLLVLEPFEPACFTSTIIVRPARQSSPPSTTMPTVPDRQALETMKRADLQRLCKVRPTHRLLQL